MQNSQNRKRQCRVDLRLTEKEYAALRRLSEASGRKMSAVLRAMLEGYRLKEAPSAELLDFNRQLLRIGVNLDQIARKANALGLLDAPYYRLQAEELRTLRLALQKKFLLPETSAQELPDSGQEQT